jgi:hypothetical protein
MSRRFSIDKINSKYRGSAVGVRSPQHVGVIGGTGIVGGTRTVNTVNTVNTGGVLGARGGVNAIGTVGAIGGGVRTVNTVNTVGNLGAVGGVTAIRRSTVSPSIVYGGPSTVRTSGLHYGAGQTVVSGIPATGSVLLPATNTQTIVRKSRVDLYPSLTGPSVVHQVGHVGGQHFVTPAPHVVTEVRVNLN